MSVLPQLPGWSAWLAAAAEVVWPRYCFICDAAIPSEAPSGCICEPCRSAILVDPFPTCPRCSSTVGPHTDVSAGCTRCQKSRLRFTGAIRLGPYDGRLRDAILRMKQPDGESLAEILGELWAEVRRDVLLTDSPSTIVPIPLHWRRRWSRGYNQSEALARGLSAKLGLPVFPSAITRVRPTPKQTAQSPTQRWENVRGAFAPKPGETVKGRTVLLVDDVMTTGATADAATAALLQAGATSVRLAILAHR